MFNSHLADFIDCGGTASILLLPRLLSNQVGGGGGGAAREGGGGGDASGLGQWSFHDEQRRLPCFAASYLARHRLLYDVVIGAEKPVVRPLLLLHTSTTARLSHDRLSIEVCHCLSPCVLYIGQLAE